MLEEDIAFREAKCVHASKDAPIPLLRKIVKLLKMHCVSGVAYAAQCARVGRKFARRRLQSVLTD